MNYTQADRYIADIPKFTTKNKPEHTKDALARLGNPQDSFRVIHVAGTNGKGSVCAFIATVLAESGVETGLFISPHLVKINERFQINGQEITDEEFLDAFHTVKKMADEMVADGEPHPTYFEYLFLMGMVVFKKKKVSYVVLETGLGGRLDATNVIDNPLISVIASISLDHTEILGDTIEAIAGEKAGIIKKNVPLVFDGKNKAAAAVIKKQAEKMESEAFELLPQMYKILRNNAQGIDFSLESGYYDTVTVKIPYIASYQVENASLAFLALSILRTQDKLLEEKLTIDHILHGFEHMKWQGRMETILPGVIVDGAHNEDGVRCFVETGKHFQGEYPLTLLFSAVVEKNYREMIKTISQQIGWKTVVVTQINGSRVVPAKELADIFKEYGCARVLVEENVELAFETACREKHDGLLFCVGSLYLVGEIKEYLGRQPHEKVLMGEGQMS